MSAVAERTTPSVPDERGRFGTYGGRYVPEVLIPALDELAAAWSELRDDPGFRTEFGDLLRDFVGRPTPITHARRLSEELGYEIWLKREDLAHTGAHKINNALGQALVAKRLGKERIIAETGAGQHGVAAATASALLGLPCVVYMGEVDTHRQAPNVARMKLLGAEVVPVMAGTRTLKEAVNEALRDWAASVRNTHYIIGSVVGPHPFPVLVRDLQRVIGDEARAQYADRLGGDPDVVVACVGGGSNAIGMFTAFVGAPGVRLIGVEAGGRGSQLGEHCSSITQGQPGILHGALSYLLQDAEGQVADTHSISAGLDYPGVGPEHAYLHDAGLAEYVSATDAQALEGFQALARNEGILPALEPSHVIGWLLTRAAPEGVEGARLPLRSGRQGPRHRSAALGSGGCLISRRRCALVATPADGRSSPTSREGSPAWTRRCCERLQDAGADAVEVGIPFSDPVMDGGVIQEASRLALEAGARPSQILTVIAEASLDVPVAVMTYVNPVYRHGFDAFLAEAQEAGVAGVIVPDLPVDEGSDWMKACAAHDVASIQLAAPGTSDERLRLIAEASHGFVYCVATYGVTGVRDAIAATGRELVERLRPLTGLPLLLGVGVGTPEQATQVGTYADGAIIGSALMARLVDGDRAGFLDLVGRFRSALPAG